jgi:hypothetical protein
MLSLAFFVAGCGTPREKTAPCKRPANLLSFAESRNSCGPATELNTDRAATLASIEQLAKASQE